MFNSLASPPASCWPLCWHRRAPARRTRTQSTYRERGRRNHGKSHLCRRHGRITLLPLRLTSADSTRMVSALSLSQALTLLAEGASGETLAELEGVIGLSLEDLREALPAYVASLPSTEKASFRSVNTVWAEQNGFTLNEAYANRLKSRYGAQITPISFTEKGAAAKINDWFSGATDDDQRNRRRRYGEGHDPAPRQRPLL